MATPRQIEANRRNALNSTGPKTPEGKAAVSLNSLRHGLRARTVVLPREDPKEFQQLCDDLEAEWQPLTRTEQFYVEQMAVAYWKLRRHERAEAQLLREHHAGTTPIMLDRLWQAQCRLERSFARAQHELERIQISRCKRVQQQLNEPVSTPQPDAAFATASSLPTAPATAQAAEGTVGPAIVPAPALQAHRAGNAPATGT